MNNIPWTKEELMKANDKLMKRNRRYKQALKFYADALYHELIEDRGGTARQTLQNK